MEHKGISAAVVALITVIAIGVSLVPVAATHDSSAEVVAPSPPNLKPDTRVLVTVKVTNTGSDDNINDVRIMISGFSQAIAGAKSGENLKLAADNWALAFENFARAGDNLVLAENRKMHAGELIASDADHLMDAAGSALFLSWENVAVHVEDAAIFLKHAGDNLNSSIENIVLIENLLIEAAIELMRAAGTGFGVPPYENLGYYNRLAGENFFLAGLGIGLAGEALSSGDLRSAGEYLEIGGGYMENAGIHLKDNSTSAGGYVKSTGLSLQKAGDNLIAAASYKENAGLVLITTAGYLKIAGSYISDADSDLGIAGGNIWMAADYIENAGTALSGSPENIFAAGENLGEAVSSLTTAASELGKVLGEDELEDAVENLEAAADYLDNSEQLNITAAGEALIGAASDFALVADKIWDVGDALASDPGASWNFDGTNKFDGAVGDNTIEPGESLNFSILLKSPNITDEQYYDIVVVTRDTTGIGFVSKTLEDALFVDGKVPGLTVVVTQAGVGEDDFVGVVKDNGKATVTVTASEVLSKLGKVSVEIENSDGLRENILVVTMSTTDNVEWTGEFSVGYWDDNTPEIEVAGCKDEVGNENEESPEHSFKVDTRPPIFLDNGLPGALANYTQVVDNWIATENDVWVISGQVLENGGSDFSVYVDSVTASIDPSDNSFSGTLNLGGDGVKTITVKAVDVLGNENSENVENIFLDTTEPTIDLVKLAGESFENNMWIGDNTPAMELAILDPGYPDTGLGVDYVNITVELYSAAGVLITAIENSNPWDPLDGSYDNDGITDGAGGALAGAQYYIGVWASDNFPGRVANENFWFRIDVIPPDIDDLIAATVVIDPETGLEVWSGSTTKEDSLDIEGTADEPGSTVHIYVDSTEHTVEADETDGSFSTTIDLSEGINKIYVKEVDMAGNESEKKLLASITADWTPPTVTITEPTTGTSTDEVSITVRGKVTDTVAEYDELVVQLDATGAFVLKTIYLNPDGTFSTTVPLTEGTNVITLYARDQAGNQDLFSVTVDRSVTSWYLYFMIVAIVIVILAAIAVLRR